MDLEWSSSERAGPELTEVRFDLTVARERIPGLLVLPRAESPSPLVVIQHPGMGSKDDYFVRDIALGWAPLHGWACMGLDAPLHGDRDDHDPMALFREPGRFAEASAQFCAELSAAVDAVAGRYPVDRGRLGYVGYSLGSMLGIPAVAADGRYRAAAFCLIGKDERVGEAPGRLAGVAVRIVAKEQDEFFPRASTDELFAALPGEKDLVWRPGGHFEIGPDVVAAAEQWLVARL